ncbi:hypothetical protein F52700_1874 [Fusarium sp. NRRL 52700]|nr:hypothetical protein F52700_1874 [Fusarium sp. NRRL 52700]
MASFTCFPDLPKELRDMIWDYASQCNLGGVQISELQSPEPKQDGETSDTTNSGASPPGQRLTATLPSKSFPTLGGNTGSSNVSRYMADIGLWTACKESRDVMEKTSQRTKTMLERHNQEDFYSWSLENLREYHIPAIVRCSTSHQLLVQPYADLFVLQPSKIEDIDWSQAISDVNAQLWIIDHNLKVRGDIGKNEITSLTPAFYARDRRLIEVYWRRQPLKHWRHVKPPERKCKYTDEDESSISLVSDLDGVADDALFDWRFYGQYGEKEDRRFNCHVRLLGWDDL